MSGVALSDAQRLDWLRLIRSENVGPRTFRALLNRFGGAGAALDALPGLGQQKLGRAVKICSQREAEKEMAAAARQGVRFVALGEPNYPNALRMIADAPPLLAAKGDARILARPAVAIVGSRNASAGGRRFAQQVAAELGREGYAIVSGLARGIDAAAHEGSIEAGAIAVLAGGHERLYPPDHAPLAERIVAKGGATLSEMPLEWEPRGRDFPRRNRIVSGLSLGVLVVEAARKSGSLITARFALEQGREVFAAPGSPLDPRSEGTNDLIRQGATLVSAAEHIAVVLAPLLGAPKQPDASIEESGTGRPIEEPLWDELGLDDAAAAAALPFPSAGSAAWEAAADAEDMAPRPPQSPGERIVALLSTAPVGLDEVARQSGLPIRVVSRIVFELELAGRIERHGANAVSLLAPP